MAKRSKGDATIALDVLAEKLLAKCDEMDVAALRELGDRVEGKAVQETHVSGPEGGPIEGKLTVELVRANPDPGEA